MPDTKPTRAEVAEAALVLLERIVSVSVFACKNGCVCQFCTAIEEARALVELAGKVE